MNIPFMRLDRHMDDNLVIFGCGSQARYVIDILSAGGGPAPTALVDIEGASQVGTPVDGVPVKWSYQQALEALDSAACKVMVAHGDNIEKLRIAQELEGRGFSFATAIHAKAVISPTAHVGDGCIVNAGVVLMPSARLERHVIVHSGSVIEHDCVIGEGANIAPGVSLAGRVSVGTGAYVYTGSSVIPNVRIGHRAVVGAGAVVIEDVPDNARVVGIPARRIR